MGDCLFCGGLVKKGGRPPRIVFDGLWKRVEQLLPKAKRRRRHPGRRQLDDRKALCGVSFMLHTGIRWKFLPVS